MPLLQIELRCGWLKLAGLTASFTGLAYPLAKLEGESLAPAYFNRKL